MSGRAAKILRVSLLITAEIALALITIGLIWAIMYPAIVGADLK